MENRLAGEAIAPPAGTENSHVAAAAAGPSAPARSAKLPTFCIVKARSGFGNRIPHKWALGAPRADVCFRKTVTKSG